ncbi:hypothetical protein VIBNISFn27_1080061 [Vibrio nigripulchritudo SFn27]|uniref:Transposase n=1 Tax=Vibrio nigripulchritudo SOn1 TaxID=1238450 RepID=A0AAV2VN56_9VIBR|nr:hypothetical protein VIBNIFTn2_430035 [Vibrio nigripulchritudo FTn2]CCN54722.1 hypothetical protein VIBNIMADA3021_570036 [Vibrio nigripulchritudo MADA3021]CCN75045.1 hypothetical protein VIBNISO65_1260035 [Vibrio nigripulchritudo SO65]CCN84470.1 hypothetical protein VIBNIBLFn1_760063 [Vibrio nigripulchritudo BLFn1]CCN86517.1 hypothetical protein VIBNISFn27_1080061 [Vibrio nigripulchritudo SFn27]CCN97060.1 hypothetical protein VIBNIENn2_870063 [Vibrio nigripulchritudo ENn2]CCO46064.1 hypoth
MIVLNGQLDCLILNYHNLLNSNGLEGETHYRKHTGRRLLPQPVMNRYVKATVAES